MDAMTDNIIEITCVVQKHFLDGHIKGLPFCDVKAAIPKIADRFQRKYADADWNELSYYDEIQAFTDKYLREVMQVI